MRRIIPVLAICIAMSACATPAGQFKPEDLATTEHIQNRNYQAIFRDMREAFRKCAVPNDGFLYTDIKTGQFDLYLPDAFGGKSPWVSSIISIKSISEESTSVTISVNKIYDKPVFGPEGRFRKQLEAWSKGASDCS